MERFVYNPKYVKLLISIYKDVAQIDDLARKHSINAGHLRIVLDQWTKEGIVNKDKVGREYQISLTAKGEVVSKKLAELLEVVRNYKEKPKREKKENESTTKKGSTLQNKQRKTKA